MSSLLNKGRPPAFCPGCSHDNVARALDKAFRNLGLPGNQIVIVSDIGCSGLIDTFFHTHALHGLHGRALTYAAGLKLARPELTVIVTMGDGGLGIGGAHFLAACRRNLDLTLLILNNFNFGMTGGQFSPTTPPHALVSSGFLNRLEKPLDPCHVAASAGAPYVNRCSVYRKDLPVQIAKAIRFSGFSVMDIWGACTGRYSQQNKLTPKMIDETLSTLPPLEGTVPENVRAEYGHLYRELASRQKPAAQPEKINPQFEPVASERQEVMILGNAGQRIVTAGEILCLAGMTAGLQVTQKNEYNITVLRGPSVSEVILSPSEIWFTGIDKPNVILALGQEGVQRRIEIFRKIDGNTLIICVPGIAAPPGDAKVVIADFNAKGIKTPDWALAALGVLAKLGKVIRIEMLHAALGYRFKGNVRRRAREIVDRAVSDNIQPAHPK